MTSYLATPAIDELHTPDGGLVLLEARLVRLGPVGSAIRAAATRPTSVPVLTDLLVSQFGRPDGDVTALTRNAVDVLLAEGLLVACDD